MKTPYLNAMIENMAEVSRNGGYAGLGGGCVWFCVALAGQKARRIRM